MVFEDFQVGHQYTLKPVVMKESDMIAYARQFDPQRIHVDAEFAREGPFSGLIASGYHTLSVVWSQWIEAGILGDESLGGPDWSIFSGSPRFGLTIPLIRW